MVETDKPTEELKSAFDLIGTYLEAFITINDLYEPIEKNPTNNVFHVIYKIRYLFLAVLILYLILKMILTVYLIFTKRFLASL